MSKFSDLKSNIDNNLNDKTKIWAPYMDLVEQKTGVPRFYQFIGLVTFTGLYLVFGFGAGLICNAIAFVYPAYMSMKALETEKKDDDTKWLTYWVVFACFSLVEHFSDFIVGWFPLYWLTKCCFVIWCYLPIENNGSIVLYHRVVRPIFQKYSGQLEKLSSSGIQAVKDLIKNATKEK